ncbi:MAG: VWA domain-containing protein [Candidatus Altiarchaeota archaeon]|nr:VWA domain-containing protein [Candidatus Altiarchaeota archaeon]
MDWEINYRYINLLILLIGLVILIYFLSKRFAIKRVITFGNFEVLEKAMGGKPVIQISLITLFLRILALTCIVIAISDIKMVQEEYVSTTDFILAIDTSSSMLTPDYEPNRLELAKKSSIEWLRKLKNTRVGVVTFAGKSYMKIEPTTDLERVENIISRLSFERPAGTAIGESLITSSALLEEEPGRNKTIILITDGRNNVGVNITESLKPLKSTNISVYAIGIGSKEEKPITVPPELIGKNATETGFPELDEETLKFLVNETNGKYFYIDDPESFKEALESGVEYQKVTKSLTFYALLAVCVILLIEWAIDVTKYRPLP